MNKLITQELVGVNLNNLIIKLFNSVLPSKNLLPFETVNKISVKFGYLIAPEACTSDILDYINSQQVNYNSTFYKKWSSVINKSRFELFIDQLIHYASTYGTNFTGEAYIPETDVDVDVPAFTTFKVIKTITKKEVISRCEKMLFSGIALKQETIQDLLSILKAFGYIVDIEKVRNKEAKMFLYKETNSVPKDAVEMVRYLVFLATDKTLLIKDKATLALIKNGSNKVNLQELTSKFGIEKLSSVFFRFKEIFLSLKQKHNTKVVNRLRKLANKFHKPMKQGYFENLLSNESYINELTLEKLEQISNFKKVLLLQTIDVRLKELENKFYLIRNQKLFVDTTNHKAVNLSPLAKAWALIYQSLVRSLSAKATTISLPKGMDLTLPTSEKSFCGNYPLGTSFDLTGKDTIVGIHWRGTEGAHDLDLKMHTIDGKLYGWNAAYKNHDSTLVFSGDMTVANPEATELFYASKGFDTAAIVKVNLYGGAMNSKFRFFIARENITSMSRNYMVDPNNIVATIESEMDSKEKTLGVITGEKFILAQFRTGKGRVSHRSVTDLYTEYALRTLDCYLSLEYVLKDAGFIITDENPKINLSTLSKDSLISLLS